MIFIYGVKMPIKRNATLFFIAGSIISNFILGQKCTMFTQFIPSSNS
jgi:hypothetical protein